MKKFADTSICRGGTFCDKLCRRTDEQGQHFRDLMRERYEMPEGDVCPPERGAKPWGYVRVTVRGAEVIRAAVPRDDLLRRMWGELHARPWAWGGADAEAAWLSSSFARRVPCGECRKHWSEILAAMPPDLSSADRYFAWTVAAHNEVNRLLGKPEMSVEDAMRSRITGNAP